MEAKKKKIFSLFIVIKSCIKDRLKTCRKGNHLVSILIDLWTIILLASGKRSKNTNIGGMNTPEMSSSICLRSSPRSHK